MDLRKCSYLAVSLAFILTLMVIAGCGGSSDSSSAATTDSNLVGTWHSDVAGATVIFSDDNTYTATDEGSECSEAGTWSAANGAFTIVVVASDCEGTSPGDTETVPYSLSTDEDGWPIAVIILDEDGDPETAAVEVVFGKGLLAPPTPTFMYGFDGHFTWWPGMPGPVGPVKLPIDIEPEPTSAAVIAYELAYDGTGTVYYGTNCTCIATVAFRDHGKVVQFDVTAVDDTGCSEGIPSLMPEVGTTLIRAFRFSDINVFAIWSTAEMAGELEIFSVGEPTDCLSGSE